MTRLKEHRDSNEENGYQPMHPLYFSINGKYVDSPEEAAIKLIHPHLFEKSTNIFILIQGTGDGVETESMVSQFAEWFEEMNRPVLVAGSINILGTNVDSLVSLIVKTLNSRCPSLKQCNFFGFSRGAVACNRVANRLVGGIKKVGFLHDPVAGPTARNDFESTYFPASFDKLFTVLAADEKRVAFTPMDFFRSFCGDVKEWGMMIMPGNHSAAAGSDSFSQSRVKMQLWVANLFVNFCQQCGIKIDKRLNFKPRFKKQKIKSSKSSGMVGIPVGQPGNIRDLLKQIENISQSKGDPVMNGALLQGAQAVRDIHPKNLYSFLGSCGNIPTFYYLGNCQSFIPDSLGGKIAQRIFEKEKKDSKIFYIMQLAGRSMRTKEWLTKSQTDNASSGEKCLEKAGQKPMPRFFHVPQSSSKTLLSDRCKSPKELISLCMEYLGLSLTDTKRKGDQELYKKIVEAERNLRLFDSLQDEIMLHEFRHGVFDFAKALEDIMKQFEEKGHLDYIMGDVLREQFYDHLKRHLIVKKSKTNKEAETLARLVKSVTNQPYTKPESAVMTELETLIGILKSDPENKSLAKSYGY
jgi:hypothetical protein